MDDLTKKLESAECGSRELDALIDREVKTPNWRERVGEEVPIGSRDLVRPSAPKDYLPVTPCAHYTTSLDAAWGLLPEAWRPGLDPIFFEEGETTKYDVILCRPHWNRWRPVDTDWIERIEVRHQNPILALCIAALKARQANDQSS